MTIDDRLADEPGPWSLVRIGPGRERLVLGREAAQADFTVGVAPETDGLLADRIGWIAEAGGRSIGLEDPGLVRLAGDKQAMTDWWLARGIRTPPVCRVEPGSALPDDYESAAWPPYPAVLKPVDGAGCLETRIVRSPRSARFWRPSGSPMLLQPFVAGDSRSAAYLCGPGPTAGESVCWPIGLSRQSIVRQGVRLRYDGGSARVGARSLEAERGLGRLPGVRGWIGVDFIRDRETGLDTLLELNPRPTTSIVGYQAALGPGWIGAQWLAVLEGRAMAGLPEDGSSWSFDASGKVREETFR